MIGLVWNSHTEVVAFLAVTSTAVHASFSSQVAVHFAIASNFVAGEIVSFEAVEWWLNAWPLLFRSRQQPVLVSHRVGDAVGAAVGARVGAAVGAAVGARVGANGVKP